MKVSDIEDMPHNAEYLHAKKVEAKFTEIVDELRKNNNPRIAEMMNLLWNLVGHKITPASIANFKTETTINFSIGMQNGKPQGMIIIPNDWLEKIEESPFYCRGGVVFIGSQCRDFWNGFLPHQSKETMNEVMNRAWAYEAEYLHGVPELIPNEYQQKVMEFYPHGLDSAPELLYESKPFV